MDWDEKWSPRSRKHRKHQKRKHQYHERRRYGSADSKDDVSCCGRPKRTYHYHHRRHHRQHKKDRPKYGSSSRRSKSPSEKDGGKDDIPSPITPPPPPPQQKRKESKNSLEIGTPSPKPTGTSVSNGDGAEMQSPSAPPSHRERKPNRESPFRALNLGKSGLLQELCVTQCIRDGYEMSRLAYATCFPVGKKPNFIYLPQIRTLSIDAPRLRVLPHRGFSDMTSVGLRQPRAWEGLIQGGCFLSVADNRPFTEPKPELHSSALTGKSFTTENKISRFVKNLNGCRLALRKARKNISNLKLLVGGNMLNELCSYDTDAKAVINDLKYLRELIDKRFES